MEIRPIVYGSEEYQQTLALRNEVMRKPLGLDIFTEDLSHEEDAQVIGAFEETQLLGMGVLSHQEKIYTIDYLCVDHKIHSKGIGKTLLLALEELARQGDATEIIMDARVSAQPFYEKFGYVPFGEIYLMTVAPVKHVKMRKVLT